MSGNMASCITDVMFALTGAVLFLCVSRESI